MACGVYVRVVRYSTVVADIPPASCRARHHTPMHTNRSSLLPPSQETHTGWLLLLRSRSRASMYYRGSSCLLFRLGGPRTPVWRSRRAAKAAIRHSSHSSSVDPVRYLVLRRRSGLAVLCSLLATALPRDGGATRCAGAARSSGRRGPEEEENDEEAAETALLRKALDAALGPVGGEITFGCLVGFTSGYALKKVGKAAAFFIGVAYVTGSTLQALGYVDVNWKKLERQVMGLLGKEDGDFSLTKADAQYFAKKLKEALTYQLPSTGGFATGFAVGIYYG